MLSNAAGEVRAVMQPPPFQFCSSRSSEKSSSSSASVAVLRCYAGMVLAMGSTVMQYTAIPVEQTFTKEILDPTTYGKNFCQLRPLAPYLGSKQLMPTRRSCLAARESDS